MPELLQIQKPKLSIILPTYNRENYLNCAIESILEQSFTDYELIIINDGSTDDSEKVINSYSDARIVYIRQQNQGEFRATNTGLRIAQGELLTWIHSDDIMPPESLSARVACLDDDKEIDLCHGDIANIDKDGRIFRFVPAVDSADGRAAFLEYYKRGSERKYPHPVHHTTVMFRLGFLQKIGYWDERLPCCADMDWLLRALKSGRIKKAPGILYWYRMHPKARRQTDTRKGLNYGAMMQVILRRHAEDRNS